MKFRDRLKLSIHLDLGSHRSSKAQPLSSKRKLDTSPTSPNTVVQDPKLKQMLLLTKNPFTVRRGSPIQQEATISKFPLLVDQFVKCFNLSKNETAELFQLKQVYYYKPQKFSTTGPNGEYMGQQKDHIRYQYEIINLIGSGSFGSVYEVYDHKTKANFALKIIRNQDKLKKQASVEVNLLMAIKDKDPQHIVKLQDQFIFRGHQCIVFEKLDCSLFEILKQQLFTGFDYETLKKIALQLVKGLNFLRNCNILHCDIKPENIMVSDQKSKLVKIIDFGTGCFNGDQFYTYIQSRYYRAPEVFFGLNYGPEIDMWSMACVIAELHTGRPLFPSENELDQFNLIVEILGAPPLDFANQCPRKKIFFDDIGYPKRTIKCYRKPQSVKLNERLSTTEDDFIDFLLKCLTWDAKSRLKPIDALQHPWLKQLSQQDNTSYVQFRQHKENQLNIYSSQKSTLNSNVMESIERTKALISHNKQKSQPTLLNSPKLKELATDRQREQMTFSIHQILKSSSKKTLQIRKPSLG